jgi:bacterioferritin (cytochrome b1)
MSRMLFLEILDGVREYDDYFEAKLDATSKVGLSSY